jgi:hypothetical protein
METATRRNGGSALKRLGWWGLFLVVVVYGVFALAMGVSELLFVLGVAAEVKHRATPVIFTIHALAGVPALLI